MLRVREKLSNPDLVKPYSGRFKAFKLTSPHIPPSPEGVGPPRKSFEAYQKSRLWGTQAAICGCGVRDSIVRY